MDNLERRKVVFYKETEKEEPKYNHKKIEPGSAFDDFEELDIENGKQKGLKLDPKIHTCDYCLYALGKIGNHLCYVCSVYMCDTCYIKHDKNHLRVKIKSERKKRAEKAKVLLAELRSELLRDEQFDKMETSIHVQNRINVKHSFDQEACWITGLCGLDNTRMVVIDNRNYCMKIFNTANNALLRYIRFSSAPRDATRINCMPTKIEAAFEYDAFTSDVSADGTDKQHQCTLAVTFPKIKQIWILNIDAPVIHKTKTIETDKECYEIEFSDKLFTLCAEEIRPRCFSVDILSMEGYKLRTIYTTLHPYMYDLAVSKTRVYLPDWNHNKIYCINAEDGETLSEIKLDGSEPTGISVDSFTNTVYVSAWEHDIIYELDSELKGYKPLILKDDNFKDPARLCFHRSKLFISHRWPSYLSNLLTVIQLS